MRTKTEILTNSSMLLTCANEWLDMAIGEDINSNWNDERLAYISRIVKTRLREHNWLEDIDQISRFYKKTGMSVRTMTEMVHCAHITHNHGESCDSLIFQLVSLLILHLSLEGHIQLRFGYSIRLPYNPSVFEWFYKRKLVADSISHIYMTASPKRYNYFKDSIPAKYSNYFYELGDNNRSTRQRAAMNLIETIIYCRIQSLDNISVVSLGEYYNANAEAAAHYISTNDQHNKTSTITYGIYLEMLDIANNSDLKKTYNEWIASNPISYSENIANKKDMANNISQVSLVRKMTCDSLDHEKYEIETLVSEVDVITIGDFTISFKANMLEFNPNRLIHDGYWKKTQLDYINTPSESGTKKIRNSRLAYLNSYLFDYLPKFFKSNPDCGLTYPSTPSEFLGFVYVKSSETLRSNHYNKNTKIFYPVGLLDYIYAITDERSYAMGLTKTNSGRDAISTIQRYFDFVIAKFSGIPCCKLESNPISDFDKNIGKGYGYKHSIKEKIDLDYWILLRMYLIEVTNACLKNAEDVVFNGKKNNESLKIDKTIEWLEHKVHIDFFDASQLLKFNFSDWKNPVSIIEYQGLLTLTLLAWSGLRDSNVLWLDVGNFTQFCQEKYSDDDFVELFVNTDKARTEGYTSAIPGHIMSLLERAAILRLQVNRAGFNEPIPYRGETNSKWPDIRPLLQRTVSNTSSFHKADFLLVIVSEFEKCLFKHNKKMKSQGEIGLDFGSCLYFQPLYANALNFKRIKPYLHAEQDYSATLIHIETGERYKFTPLKKSVAWTPHSLRKTFDSVCSVLADPRTVGLISTGQKPETVGYYTVNTPEETARIRAIHDASGLNKQFAPEILNEKSASKCKIASVNDLLINEEEYLKQHALGTATTNFGCYSMSSIVVNGIKSPIEALVLASANEIAFNRTHICPFNNECPKEVLAALMGEKCCAVCPYAIVSRDHAVAIGAELKRLGDIAADLTKTLKNSRSLTSGEKDRLKQERMIVIKNISGWLVRHNFLSKNINTNDYFTGKKNDMLVKHISSSISGKNIIDRLMETDGISTVTSPRLEREASKLNRKLTALINMQPDVFEKLDSHSASESEVAIQLINSICTANNFNTSELASRLEESNAALSKIKMVELQ